MLQAVKYFTKSVLLVFIFGITGMVHAGPNSASNSPALSNPPSSTLLKTPAIKTNRLLPGVQLHNPKLVFDFNTIYQLHKSGEIYEYTRVPCQGQRCTGWRRLDRNPDTIAITAYGNRLIQLHRTGAVFEYTGHPCQGNRCTGWRRLDNNANIKSIMVGGAGLFELHRNGAIYRYTGHPCVGNRCNGWQRLDANPATVAITVGGRNLYQLHRTGAIFEYTGHPCQGNRCIGWRLLDRNPATIAIAAGASSLFQLHRTGAIYKYTGHPCQGNRCTGWQLLDRNPASTAIAASAAGLFQLHRTGAIFEYTGHPCQGNRCIGWRRLDHNPATIAITTSGSHMYQFHRSGEIFQYAGQPCRNNACWIRLDRNRNTVGIAGAELVPHVSHKLLGWADLHTHPASHLSFGADANGNNGIFWGKPGLKLETSNVIADLPVCTPDKHGNFDMDFVRHMTHQTVISTIDNLTGFTHKSNGASSFSNWPNARSLTHQQMHISMIKRAYDGGQRLIIASVTDNEFLSALWTKIGYNAAGNQVPLHDPNQNYNSAVRQLDFIRRFVAANPSWMEIARSAADARRIISSNKMAVILSLEMDTLSYNQILKLVRERDVREVIPIHLINNDLGGTAVYTDAFNTVNAFVHSTRQRNNWNNLGNDGFFKVSYDTNLTSRLGRPQTLVAEGGNLVQGGAIWPRQVDDATWASLGYDAPLDRGGHRNQLGLTNQGKRLLKDLAKMGVLIDVAHMSQNSTEDALSFAMRNHYPMLDSHTGLRNPDETAANERALMRRHARIISDLGGVIGLGTEGTSGQQPIIIQPPIPQNNELVRFTGHFTSRSWQVSHLVGNPLVSNLTVTIKTGQDDLRGGKNWVKARVTIRGRASTFSLSRCAHWAGGSIHTVTFALPAGTRANDISRFTLVTNPNGKNSITDSPDNWNVDELRVDATLTGVDTVGTWLKEYKDVLAIMNGRGVGFGTDMNGFAPQIPFAAQDVHYPVTIASRFGPWPGGYTPPSLQRARLGRRTFDFKRDGIADYGMLSDFVQALSQKPRSSDAVAALFHSANDVVEMWEKCEEQGHTIR